MRRRILLFTLLALAAVVPLAGNLTAQSLSTVAITDARIVTVSGAVIEKGTVLLHNGVIADVGPAVAVPKTAWVIDGKGLTVYPGLIDAYSSWALPESVSTPPAAAARGAQAQRQASAPAAPQPRSLGPQDRPGTFSWVKAADLVTPTERRVEQARSAGFTTAVTFPRQGLIGGQGAVVNLGGETAGQMVVAPEAGLQMSFSPSGYMGYPASLMGVFAYFKQLWIDAESYRNAKELYAKSPATIQRPAYDRALEGVLQAKLLLLPAATPVQLERMVKLATQLKTPAVYCGVVEGFRMGDLLKKHGASAILNLKYPVRERDSDPEAEESLKTLELRDKAPTSPAVLAAAGVKFAVSSDGLEAPRDVIKALKKSIDLGLKPAEALRALTLSAAEIYGVAGRLGSIEKGKIANLVVTDGDLFDDKTKVRMVFVDGAKYLPAIELPTPPGGNGGGPRPSIDSEEEER